MKGSKNGRSGGNKKKSGSLVDQYKDCCPPEKRKDLEALINKCGGAEKKITESIQEWWDNPTPQEPEWEDVNKKSKKKVTEPTGKVRGNSGRGPGRGRNNRGGGGGRGAGAERGRRGGRGGGRGGRESRAEGRKQQQQKQASQSPTTENLAEKDETSQGGVPTPAVASAPQGAWGPQAAAPASETKSAPSPPPTPVPMEQQQSQPLEIPIELTPQKVTQNGRSSGNVWATKGSAHLIKAEKPPPAPPTPPAASPTPPLEASPVLTTRKSQPARVAPLSNSKKPSNDPPATSALESGLPASVNGANINAAGWKPALETTQLDSLGTTMAQTIVKELKEPASPPVSVQPVSVQPVSVPPVPVQAPAKTESVVPVSKPPPTNVLNMGHWETGDNDDTQNLDFGFGSFGTENDTPSVGETTMSGSSVTNINQNPVETVTKEAASQPASSTQQPSVSPARPPPGLSIAPLPTNLPANAVLVSDLESKLESASLKPPEPAPQAPPEPKSDIPRHAAPPGVPPQAAPIIPGGGMNQNYNTAAYGMASMSTMSGMYSYNAAAASNGFVSMHGAPVLAGGIPQKPQGGIAGQPPPSSSGPQHLPQGGLYGAPAVSQAGTDNSVPSDTNSSNIATTQANSIPPGIQNAMPAYANPAALFYGQQAYQMGQPHGVGGYGYGYGAAQFGGAVQGGFGYQQGMMGQSGGYPYDDQQQQGTNGGYQKNNTGGYRGRGGGNQYQQNNYNPQGGYGGQPYGMGYNQGYGPGNMDPYSMQQGAGNNFQSHSFQNDDNHHKGGKRGGSRNNGFQQQQQHAQQQLGGQQQQSFGLQGGDTNTNNNAGWSNQANGWGGPSWPGS